MNYIWEKKIVIIKYNSVVKTTPYWKVGGAVVKENISRLLRQVKAVRKNLEKW